MPLLSDSVRHWRQRGYVVVPGLVRVDVGAASALCRPRGDFGDELGEFPTGVQAIDDVTVDPALTDAVRALLGCDDVLLTQSVLWAKDGDDVDAPNRDQRMHQDWPNHTWLRPCWSWAKPETVAAIVAYSSVRDTGGATAIVAREGDHDAAYAPERRAFLPGVLGRPFDGDRTRAEALMRAWSPTEAAFRAALYEREVPIWLEPGDVLFYSHAVWHRGTPVHRGMRRVVQSLSWCRRDCAHRWERWGPSMLGRWAYDAGFQAWVRDALTDDQRKVIGVPRESRL